MSYAQAVAKNLPEPDATAPSTSKSSSKAPSPTPRGSHSDDDDFDLGKGGLVPCTHEAIIKSSAKAITAMSIDPAGSRLLAGGHECSLKMYDFNGMNQNLNHFSIYFSSEPTIATTSVQSFHNLKQAQMCSYPPKRF